MTKHTKSGLFIALTGLFGLVCPAALTLSSVRSPGQLIVSHPDPTPLGFTVSLLLFFVPDIILIWWIARHPDAVAARKAFFASVASIFVTGCILDFGFARSFFTYPNRDATLGIRLPAFSFTDGWQPDVLPVEEFGFYFFGGVFMVGLYVWSDLVWFGYAKPGHPRTIAEQVSARSRRLVPLHPWPLVAAAALAVAAVVGRKLFVSEPGFPGYFIWLVVGALLPTAITYPIVKDTLNWQALSLMFVTLQLISLLWEVTVAVPYNWWNYQHQQMLGIYIGAWFGLPIESVIVWVMAGWASALMYEWYRIVFHLSRPGLPRQTSP